MSKREVKAYLIRVVCSYGVVDKKDLFLMARKHGFDTTDPNFRSALLDLDEDDILDVGLTYVRCIGEV